MAYAAQLRKDHPEVVRIIWFGSWVNGIPMPYSDVDVCVILKDSPKRFRDRIPDYLGGRFPGGMDVLPYTEAEFEHLATSAPSLHQAILSGKDI